MYDSGVNADVQHSILRQRQMCIMDSYLPVLKDVPAKYIYKPWTAPKAVLKAAGVVLGENYPRRIVDHDVVSKINMGRMKEAYDKHHVEKSNDKDVSNEEKSVKRKSPHSKVIESFFHKKAK